ncbi:MAG: hypothetical protein HY402_00415 [Elusimicrobia bacterium]|nr:hypothetical protein [Elusimicrobiota bacterium]
MSRNWKWSVWAVSFCVGWWGAGALFAGEHPKEHPTEHSQEHPTGKKVKGAEHSQEHPAGKKAEGADAAEQKKQELREHFSKTVEQYLEQKSGQTEGFFVVRDAALGVDWRLKLDHIHKHRIVSLGKDRFFACADFKQKRGRFSSDKLDLDFYVAKKGGKWKVEEVLIHKVNGRPRYTYDAENRRIPVPQESQKGKK